MTKRVKLWRYFKSVTKDTNIFAFEGFVIIGLNKTQPDGLLAKIGLSDPMTNRVKVWRYFKGVTEETNIFAFEVKVKIGLESTCPED